MKTQRELRRHSDQKAAGGVLTAKASSFVLALDIGRQHGRKEWPVDWILPHEPRRV